MSEKNCVLKQRCDDSNELSKFKMLNCIKVLDTIIFCTGNFEEL